MGVEGGGGGVAARDHIYIYIYYDKGTLIRGLGFKARV